MADPPAAESLPRYVILFHAMPEDSRRRDHWDVMLERDGALRTWAVPVPAAGTMRSVEPVDGTGPVDLPPCNLHGEASELEPHRLDYLEYEGPVSGDRGSVRRCLAGVYETVAWSDDGCRVRLRAPSGDIDLLLERKAATDGSAGGWRIQFATHRSPSETRLPPEA